MMKEWGQEAKATLYNQCPSGRCGCGGGCGCEFSTALGYIAALEKALEKALKKKKEAAE